MTKGLGVHRIALIIPPDYGLCFVDILMLKSP
jgi:hypothetical protein